MILNFIVTINISTDDEDKQKRYHTIEAWTLCVYRPTTYRKLCRIWGSQSGGYDESFFWETTPRSALIVNRCFRGKCRLHFQGRRMNQARNQRESRRQAQPPASTLVFCLAHSWPWRRRRHVPPKRQLTFNRLQGVISQEEELFI
jgi:hypothetical protein